MSAARLNASFRALGAAAGLVLLSACRAGLPPLEAVDYVDLERFMGDWYVIANIPTFIEEGAHNAVESYRLDDDGTIRTTFRFRDGAFDGPAREYTPRGFVRDEESNAVWGMQFIWPIKADYRITWLDEHYTQTVIARQQRDHVWVMARTPTIPDDEFARIVEHIRASGYDVSQLRRVPQRW